MSERAAAMRLFYCLESRFIAAYLHFINICFEEKRKINKK